LEGPFSGEDWLEHRRFIEGNIERAEPGLTAATSHGIGIQAISGDPSTKVTRSSQGAPSNGRFQSQIPRPPRPMRK
jgi:hypothetical protein